MVAVNAECHCFALTPNHGDFPLFSATQIFEFSYMVYFKRHILCAAPLAFVRLQPFNQAVAPIVLNHSCYYIGIAAFDFGIPTEPVIIEQHFTCLAVFLRIFHNEIFPLTVLANNSADSCPIFSGESFEHTVSHYIVEVIEYRHVVCKSIIVIQSTDFCVVLVQDFQIVQMQQAGAPDGFPNLLVTILLIIFNQKEGLIPRSLLRNKLFQDMEEVIY